MENNEFDRNVDLGSEDFFDPEAFLGSEDYGDDIDLSQFSDEELGLSPMEETQDQAFLKNTSEDDFNLDFLDDSDDVSDGATKRLSFPSTKQPRRDSSSQDSDDFDSEDYDSEDYDPNEEYDEDEDSEGEGSRLKSLKITLPKITMPNFFGKFIDLYFAPLTNKEYLMNPADPQNPRRRRRKSRVQIFKEVYLPPILVCLCLILVLSFAIGSVSNFIEKRREETERNQSHLTASISDAQQAAQRKEQIMAEAEALVQVYNYEAAITKLESIGDMSSHPDVATKHSEYVTAKGKLIAHKDPSLIPNLSFHVLIEDLPRAMADTDNLAGLYNRNFVSTGEFKKILEQLYNNGYVLVDFNSFTGSNVDASGKDLFFDKTIYLPEGKKPIMITETLVNYFNYMIGDSDDKKPNAKGDGFAYKLVVQNGEIKSRYIDAQGQDLVGDYDLVPILETFLKTHPDFSYQGARATLAVTGSEGIFGYRITSDYISILGQDYVTQEIAECKTLVQALRDKGYTLACFTYANKDYKKASVNQINTDLQSWITQIAPVIGNVNVFVFAQSSDIDYTGPAFQPIYDAGFRYFVSNGTATAAQVNNTYVYQKRLMVTGNTMQWNPQMFTKNNIFDPAAVLDMAVRKNVPN